MCPVDAEGTFLLELDPRTYEDDTILIQLREELSKLPSVL
jgi:hypothetical protein